MVLAVQIPRKDRLYDKKQEMWTILPIKWLKCNTKDKNQNSSSKESLNKFIGYVRLCHYL